MGDTPGDEHMGCRVGATLAPALDAIPVALRAADRWVLWRTVERGGTRTKVPHTPGGAAASSTDPRTWVPFAAAAAAYRAGGFDGVGVVLGGGLAGVDLDDCRDPGTGGLLPWAAAVVRRLATYAEVSPSGTGVKLFLIGAKPAGRCRTGCVEMYDRGRYFAVTGRRLPDAHPTVEARGPELAAYHREVFPSGGPARVGVGPPPPPDRSDAHLFAAMFGAANGGRVRALFTGDVADYPSRSEADLALCAHLAFYFRTPDRIDRAFRQSALYRPKWDERRGGRTYGQRTVAKALEGRAEFYAPRRAAIAVRLGGPASLPRFRGRGPRVTVRLAAGKGVDL